jgi:hypothetical protein
VPPAPAPAGARRVPALYLATIFLSAFLLFLVQPMIARRILPWFGGAAAVWTTCLLFFQALLLGGYYYAHRLSRLGRPGLWHMAALGAGVVSLPLLAVGSPPAGVNPSLGVLAVLALWVGAPYFLLSTTGPLIQSWFAREFPGVTPYRLYAVSNAGSLLGLLAYPVAVEPLLGVTLQLALFAAGFGVFAVLAGLLARRTHRRAPGPGLAALAGALESPPPPPAKVRAAWLVYPALSSALLLAITTHLTQNIAPVPFLWVLPLALYLLSFIICFDRPAWYRRAVFHPLTMAALAVMAWAMLMLDPASTISLSIPLFSGGLFVLCMYCHGELAALKPAPAFLTGYYLRISLGGAAGALAIAVGAPLALKYYFELAVVLVACAMLALMVNYRRHWLADAAWAAVAVGTVVSALLQVQAFREGNLSASRNFYGALRIVERGGAVSMIHGTVNHGLQWRDPARRREPTAYFGRTSGIGRLLASRRASRVGIIGLGAGTLAVYARPGDRYRFYELNPQVAEQAKAAFTFLSDAGGAVDVVIGDGRLSLEREAPNRFDVLVVDAFSGDSIPVHLLTEEAGRLYRRHLAPGGVLALHISNSSLDLAPVAAALAGSLGATAHIVADPGDAARRVYASLWALIPLSGETLPGEPLPADPRRLWTDEYSNLLSALR